MSAESSLPQPLPNGTQGREYTTFVRISPLEEGEYYLTLAASIPLLFSDSLPSRIGLSGANKR